MRTRARLPAYLGDHFSLAEAARAGVGRSRRDAPDLHRPFHGVRTRWLPETFLDLIDAYVPRMKPTHRFGGRTALRLWGIPHPEFWKNSEPLVVCVPPDAAPPRTPGVRGRRLALDRADTVTVRGARVVDPIAAVLSCASELEVVDAVAALDALITTCFDYPGLGPGRPMTTIDAIEQRLASWGRFPGCATIRSALPFARPRVESPKETATRLLITDAGLPEPEIQYSVFDDGRFVARVDLAYPRLKIAVEYEGDEHRSDVRRWRRDIVRQRELEALGWIVIRLTQADLADRGASALAAIRHALVSRA